MLTKEQIATFRAAPWTSAEEIESFAASAEGVDSGDVETLLGLLGDRALAADGQRQRQRCAAFVRLAQGVPDKALFPVYLKALRQPDRNLRGALSTLLPAVTEVARHAQVCELLRSPDEDLRAAGVRILKEVAGRSVLQILGEMVKEPDFPGRREVVELLVPLAGSWCIPVLKTVLEVGKPIEKRLCLRHLADPEFVGNSAASALEAIGTVLYDPSELVAAEAVAAFCVNCSEEQYFDEIEVLLDSDRLGVVRAAIAGLGRHPGPRGLLALERKLRQGPTDVRLTVIDTLEQIATDEIVPLLVEGLSHRNLKVRTRAGEVMSRLSASGKLNIARTIIWLLRSPDTELRRTAAGLVGSVADPAGELWPKLLGFLRDEDWWVRERVTDALLEMAGDQLSPLMAGYLSDPSDVIRRFAVETLGRLKDPKTLGALLRTATEDADWWVRERAIEAVAAVGDSRAAPYLVNIMGSSPDVRVACLRALKELPALDASPRVAAVLTDPDPDVRVAAVQCLSAWNDASWADAIRPLVEDALTRVRVAAIEALNRWQLNLGGTEGGTQGLSRLDTLLVAGVERKADDLVLVPGQPPFLKRIGQMEPLEHAVVSAEEVRNLLAPHLTAIQLEDLKARRDVDFSYDVPARGLRFRVNVFNQLAGLSAVFRVVRTTLPELAELGLPEVVAQFGGYRDGLVLVGGPTGSGKSTTLAALIDRINRTSCRHIISIEDPIEVIHSRKQSLVNQREMGTHTRSTLGALRSTLRQDPDVLLVGEMRDLPTISFAVTAAETGHLVFGTLHTASADTTVDRVINAFPPNAQDQVRSMLADSLRAVVCQQLIRRKDGSGRVLAAEVLVNNDAVANLIRKGKAFQLPSVIATSRAQGMQPMNAEIRRLLAEDLISADDAFMKATDKKEFEVVEDGAAPPVAGRASARAG